MPRFRLALVLALGLLVPRPAAAMDESLRDELAALSEQAATINDLQAQFTQEKHTALLKKPLTSTGRVQMLGRRSRWDTDKPYASVTLVEPKAIRIYYPEEQTLEVYPLDRRLRELVMSPRPDLETLVDRFEIERVPDQTDDQHLALRLVPRQEQMRERLRSLTVRIDRASGLATQIAWTDADEETTRISFDKVKVNRGIDEGTFELDLPENVEVVYPMGPADETDGDPPAEADGPDA